MFRKILTAAAIVIGLLALTATYRHFRPGDLEPIGSEWYIKPVSASWFGHSSNWHDLYRKSGPWFVRVDSQVSLYRYYPPDCVLFESRGQGIRLRETGSLVTSVIVAACGARTPVPIDANGGVTRYEEEGLVRNLSAGSTEIMPIAAIRELANRQPPYRRDWRTHASFDLTSPITPVRR